MTEIGALAGTESYTINPDISIDQRKRDIFRDHRDGGVKRPLEVNRDGIMEFIRNFIDQGYYLLKDLKLEDSQVDKLNKMGYISRIDDILYNPLP